MNLPSLSSPNPPLRVLHVITGLGVGGAESMLARMVSLAPADLLEQRVVSLTPGGDVRAVLDERGVAVCDLGMRRSLPNPMALLSLVRIIRQFRPDVVQGWMYHADLLALAATALSGRRSQTRLAWGVRCSDMDTSRYAPRLRQVIGLCARLSSLPDAVIANSSAGRDVHQALGYRPRRFEVIPNGIDVDRFRPDPAIRERVRAQLGIPADRRVVIQVARVDPMKDYDGLLAALRMVPGVDAMVVGEGTLALADQPGLHRLGRRGDVADLLCAADLVVSSSAFGEGFSNALAEGMSVGLPAVATDVGDARVVVGDSGVVVPPRDPRALAEAMERMLAESDAVHAERSAAARRHIVENFAVEAIIRRFAETYSELAAPCAA